MTNRFFSSAQLYALRNDINVQKLIEKTLRIPCNVTKGRFRFLCPLCKGFDTAVNQKTNLARCFHCEKNFNTIDLVMLFRHAKFVDTVRFLKSIHQKDPRRQNCEQKKTISATNLRKGRMKPKTNLQTSPTGPRHIREIMGRILTLKHSDITKKHLVPYNQKNAAQSHQNPDQDRIANLKRQLEHLDRQIQELTRTITAIMPPK
jgi:DNA primase